MLVAGDNRSVGILDISCLMYRRTDVTGFYVKVVVLLGVFAKLRKVTISFDMSVRLFARNNSAPTGRIFMKFDICVFCEKLLRKLKFH